MERMIRRTLCLAMGALVLGGLLLMLAGLVGALQGAPWMDVLWRLSGLAALAVASWLATIGIGILRTHALGVRILEAVVLLAVLSLVVSLAAAISGFVPEWAPLLPGLVLVGIWGFWLASQLVDLRRWRR
ncbi:MAG TPA: hypothetical protein ENK31_04585 [Nannocystis exedens]|nr:hypothetical protein [Nannocystis exedens]